MIMNNIYTKTDLETYSIPSNRHKSLYYNSINTLDLDTRIYDMKCIAKIPISFERLINRRRNNYHPLNITIYTISLNNGYNEDNKIGYITENNESLSAIAEYKTDYYYFKADKNLYTVMYASVIDK